jgi:Sec-independent protein translocase protein TatA
MPFRLGPTELIIILLVIVVSFVLYRAVQKKT